MALQRSSFSYRTSDFWVSVKLQGFHAPPDPKSQFVGELSLRQDQIHQKRFLSHVLDEFPLGPDRLDPSIYEALAPYIKSMALKLAYPNGSLGFIMVARLKILSIEYVDDLFGDLSDSMSLLAIGSSNGGSTSSSFSLDFVVEKLGAERIFERGDGDLGTCSICLEELLDGKGSELIRMPCSHIYHPSCILRWFNMEKKTCPNCRCQFHAQDLPVERKDDTMAGSAFEIAKD